MTVMIGPAPTREAILDAAEATFGDLGYRAATMARVAERAGVSRPLVHRYFGDKETLYREVVDRLLTQWHEALQNAAGTAAPTTGHTLRRVMAECVGWARLRPMLRGLLLRDADATRLVARTTLAEGRGRLPALFEAVLAEGVRRGDVRGDLPVAETAAVLAEVVVAGSIAAMRSATDAEHARREETMIEVVLHGVVLGSDR